MAGEGADPGCRVGVLGLNACLTTIHGYTETGGSQHELDTQRATVQQREMDLPPGGGETVGSDLGFFFPREEGLWKSHASGSGPHT